jgi:NADH:ubiquinone oxidoreductase subunit 6 (subunit J)
MSMAHLRPLSFGEILDSAFSLYRRHFVTLVTAALIPVIPSLLLTGVFARSALTAEPADAAGAFGAAMIPIMVLGIVAGLVMWGALIRMVGEAWTGGEVSVGDGYRRALRSFFPLLGSVILVYIILIVIMFAVLIVMALVGGILAGIGMSVGNQTAAVVLLVPVVLLAMAAIVVAWSTLFAVLPAIMIEKKGPLEAIGRSVHLSRGALPRVTGIVVVTFIILFLPMFFVMAVTGGFAAFTNPGAVPSAGSFWTQQVANSLMSALTTPFMIASVVILYFDRRVRTEAFDVQLAADALAGDTVAAG